MKTIVKNICALFGRKSCCKCSKHLGWFKKFRQIGGAFYCNECARSIFKICDCCDNVVEQLKTFKNKKICSDCFEGRTNVCEECGVRKWNKDLREFYNHKICGACYRSLHRSFKSINIGYKKEESKTFIKTPLKGYCGVEIECLNGYLNKNCFITSELKKLRFSQGTDGSISDEGVEFRSIPMNGDLLFDSINAFGKILHQKDYEVDKSCGLHIHLEVERQVEFLKKVYLFYLRFEDLFFDMLPKSRRKSSYCERFKEYYTDTIEEIMGIKTLSKFKEMIYETINYQGRIRRHYYRKRRCWVNLHSIFYRGTLEIRSHSGTINPSKIINWIMIHQRVLEFLNEKSLKEIRIMKVTKKAFLEMFSKPLQNYIKKRWKTFVHLEEKDLNARSPSYLLRSIE